MSHILLRTGAFVRATRMVLRREPALAEDLETAFRQLEADPYHPSLKTHKLRGELREFHACSAGYDLRIVFRFTKYAGKPAILLQTIGTHDEVY